MANTIDISIVSHEAEVFSGKAEMVYVKGEEGDLGISPGHLQLLTKIAPGPVRFKVPNQEEEELLFVSGGILEVQPDHICILADVIERPQDVNEAAANAAKKKAEELLAKKDGRKNTEAQHDLTEAMARLQVIELMRRKKGRH